MLGSTTAGSMAAGRALGPVRYDVVCAHVGMCMLMSGCTIVGLLA